VQAIITYHLWNCTKKWSILFCGNFNFPLL